jgi:hypothetical protein
MGARSGWVASVLTLYTFLHIRAQGLRLSTHIGSACAKQMCTFQDPRRENEDGCARPHAPVHCQGRGPSIR